MSCSWAAQNGVTLRELAKLCFAQRPKGLHDRKARFFAKQFSELPLRMTN